MKKKYLCTHCWQFIEEDLAFYSCPECNRSSVIDTEDWAQPPPVRRPAMRQRVRDLRRSWQHIVFSESSLTLCRKHPNVEGDLSCECTWPLTQRNAIEVEENGERAAIRVIGSRASGKTLWLATVCRSLRNPESPYDLLEIGETGRIFALVENAVLRGEKPLPTRPGANLRYAWRIQPRINQRTPSYPILMVQDVAGEEWARLERGNTHPELDRYIKYPGDLVFVIDGAQLAADLPENMQGKKNDAWEKPRIGDSGYMDRTILENILKYLPQNKTEAMRLALVITKADRLLHLQGEYPILDCPNEFQVNSNYYNTQTEAQDQDKLQKLLAHGSRSALTTYGNKEFKECRIFTTSALGFCPQPEDIENDKILKKVPDPKCAATSLLWLLSCH
ncbi:hypothetical protein TI03_00345 [Achromatium sp. WMS1]|nr:hypothetical protein TI03_00345 [Achromatium sp. WMS1]